MGTITARRRSNGTTGYTAQIRLKREGRVVHTQSETFSSKALARTWMTRREAELDVQRAPKVAERVREETGTAE